MAVGIPVVSTRAQGNEEFCLHGRTALLANAKDSHVLSHHMQHLFNNEDYAANLAAQGHEFIKQYTWDRSIDALELELFGKGKVIDPVVVEPGLVSFGKADCTIEYPKISYPYKHIKEEVTIIIPTVNDYKKVTACIGSLSHQLSGREDYEVIVVDDGTQDKEILDNLELMSESMKFRLIKNGMNLGFSASVNRGLIESTGRYTVLLNNDVLLMDNCLRELVKLGDSDEKIGVIGAKLLYPDHRIQHGGMNKLPNSLYFPHMSRYMARDDPAANVTRKVWAVTGAVFAIKRQALEILGGFSTAYATAWEDVDYCMHAWDNGLQVYYCAEAEAIHLECATRGLTFEDRKKRPLIWMEREKAGENYFTRKWAGVAHLASPEYLNSRS
jgi:GT2 family glycosyltransferase